MKLLFIGAIVVAALIGAVMVYARTARIDPARWHVAPEEPDPTAPDIDTANSRLSLRSFDTPPAAVQSALDAIIRATPRTSLLAGSVDDAMITYVTRSGVFGFPDITTAVARADDRGGTSVIVFGRAVMGYSDLGENARRVDGWLGALEAGLGE
jgi:uncharacterized protein (DUF1499 family)